MDFRKVSLAFMLVIPVASPVLAQWSGRGAAGYQPGNAG